VEKRGSDIPDTTPRVVVAQVDVRRTAAPTKQTHCICADVAIRDASRPNIFAPVPQRTLAAAVCMSEYRHRRRIRVVGSRPPIRSCRCAFGSPPPA
jgi:hypothetical protein